MMNTAAVLLLASALVSRPAPGDPAPGFELQSTGGEVVRLADLQGKTVVLAFFPKAFTGGCTREMSTFRDRHGEFEEAGAQVLGVSTDDLETQTRFAESLSTPFPMLSDPDGVAAKAYGVYQEAGIASRVTFIIDPEGKVKEVLEGADALDPAGALAACQRR
jgi:peroxiredoxin Q/BCP